MLRLHRAALASLCLWLGLPAQDFVPVQAAVTRPRTVLTLSPAVRLVLTTGELRLVTATDNRAVACTVAGGAGKVHGIVQDGEGTVFVAADHGLFVLDAGHPVLDPMDLRDGVPPGVPRSLFVDQARRLWLCTETAFGVIDPRFGFGRTFGPDDGLPAAPFSALGSDAEGRLLLAARDGTFAYTPDVGPPPQGVTPSPQQLSVTASADGDAVLTLDVTARGGATLRQRRQNHHLLQPMQGTTLRGLRPGHHLVEVHAIDRDLRRTRIAVADVRVPLAPVLDPRVLPAIAVALALALFLLAFRSARAAPSLLRRIGMAASASALVYVGSLQLLAACLGYGRSWPFVGFSMYTEVWREDAIVYKPRLMGVLADGTRVEPGLHEVGLLQDGYWQMLAEVVFGGEPAQRQFLARWNGNRHAGLPRLRGFWLADGRIRLTANGPVDAAPTVLVHYEAP